MRSYMRIWHYWPGSGKVEHHHMEQPPIWWVWRLLASGARLIATDGESFYLEWMDTEVYIEPR